MHSRNPFRTRLPIAAAIAFATLLTSSPTHAQGIVISQIYGGGGNNLATYKNDFIELFNPTSSPVSLTGWSVQYTSSLGTLWQVTPLSGTIGPGHYFLIQEAQGAGGTTNLPTPDVIGSIPMGATTGKVALLTTTVQQTIGCPSANVVDLVGYGTANCFLGSGPAPTLSNPTSTSRNGLGCANTHDNAADFGAPATPNPRNSASPTTTCGTPTPPSGVGLATPGIVAPGNPTLLTVSVTPGTLPASTGLAVTVDLTSIGLGSSPMFDDGTHGDAVAGDLVFSNAVTLSPVAVVGPKSLAATITDAQGRTGTADINLLAVFPTNPAPQPLPYSQDFSALPWSSTTYPDGWQGWELSSSPGPAFPLGGPNLDQSMLPLRDASANAVSNYNYNGQLGYISGTGHVLGLVLALNTTGHHGVLLRYDIGTMHNPYDGITSTCIDETAVQYRVGTSGAWTTISGTEYQSGTTQQIFPTTVPQNPRTIAVTLPSACDDQPVVQLRWATRDISPPTVPGRPSFAVDNVLATDLPATIVASAGSGGSISPSGSVLVPRGNSQTFTITPNSCYLVSSLTIDGQTQAGATSYTFPDVQADHTIVAAFAPNPPPAATITGPASGAVYAVNTAVSFTGTFTDNPGDTHTAAWTLDNVTIPGTVDDNAGTVSATYTFTVPGVYAVSLAVTDPCGGVGTATTVGTGTNAPTAMVVVYDPKAGFVVGGGWITSPAGALTADPAASGRANFAFVSKYQKGATVPTGETEFEFQTSHLLFASTSYDWLVVSGSAKAQYKGSGSINRTGNYGFLLTAIDGQASGGGGQDKFRIKIWDKATSAIVYDNMLNAPDTADPSTIIGGGAIVIRTGGGTAALQPNDDGETQGGGVLRYALSRAEPNPLATDTQIRYSVPEPSRVRLTVFDISGREVRTLVDDLRDAGLYTARWNGEATDGTRVDGGIYFMQMRAAGSARGTTFESVRRIVVVR